jgi:hypothetical protein
MPDAVFVLVQDSAQPITLQAGATIRPDRKVQAAAIRKPRSLLAFPSRRPEKILGVNEMSMALVLFATKIVS